MVRVSLVLIFCVIAFVSARSRKLFSRDAVSYAADGLKAHNTYRAIHNAPAMVLDDKMSAQAQAYAEKIAALPGVTLSHDDTIDDGENIFAGCNSEGRTLTASEATAAWYNEICKPGYDFNNQGFSSGTGHFTQLVWKESTKLGLGYATKSLYDGYFHCTFVVARYGGAGNFGGQFEKNVEKGSFDKSKCPKEEKRDLDDDKEIHIFKKTTNMKEFMQRLDRAYRRQ